jgi:hypothetical protein
MHMYLQWGGKLPGGEQWSNGLRMINKGSGAIGDETAMLAGAGAALVAFHQRPDSGIHPSAKLSFVKINPIKVDGRYATDGTTEAIYADASGGASAAIVYPNQVALVISLTTGFSRGPAARGRIYLPLPAIATQADGLIGAGGAGLVGTSFDTLRTNLNAVHANWEVGVMSRKKNAPGARKVTGCDVGRVLDTQRRRRRSLGEAYV